MICLDLTKYLHWDKIKTPGTWWTKSKAIQIYVHCKNRLVVSDAFIFNNFLLVKITKNLVISTTFVSTKQIYYCRLRAVSVTVTVSVTFSL